jgi:copper resistance protein B
MHTVVLFLLTGWLVVFQAAPTAAQGHSAHPPGGQPPMPMPEMGTPAHAPAVPHAAPAYPTDGTTTLPNLADRAGWPSPVADSAFYSFLRFDLLEYQRSTDGLDALRWDLLGWFGGDYHRLWVKSEGRSAPREDSEVEAQVLYGRLIAPFFDLQAGLRFDQRIRPGSDPTRVYAVLGLQGLAPYRFDIEPTMFISNKGKVSARLTAAYDVLLTQRLVVQPRLETNIALQKDEALGSGAGVNDLDLSLRLRYEIRREFAPYVGFTWKESFGETHDLLTREGAHPAHLAFVAGVRLWY